jgi:hypothetical protein
MKGWIVRKQMKPAAAKRASFAREVQKILAEVFPLYGFLSLP